MSRAVRREGLVWVSLLVVFRYQEVLKEVLVPVISNEQCQRNLRENTRLGPFFELDSSFMCAGGIGGVDTCKGDGGSPLVCKTRNGPWYQVKNIYIYICIYI